MLPIAICTPDESSYGDAWFVFVLVLVVYFGLVVIAVRGAPPEARVRVAATWLLSAVAVTILARSLAEAGVNGAAIFLVGLGVAAVVAAVGISVRRSERAWPYVMAGAIGGITPVALVIGLLAWFFAHGGCLG